MCVFCYDQRHLKILEQSQQVVSELFLKILPLLNFQFFEKHLES